MCSAWTSAAQGLLLYPYLYCSHCALSSVCSGMTPQPCVLGLPIRLCLCVLFLFFTLAAHTPPTPPPPIPRPYRSSPSSSRLPSPRRRHPSMTGPSRLALPSYLCLPFALFHRLYLLLDHAVALSPMPAFISCFLIVCLYLSVTFLCRSPVSILCLSLLFSIPFVFHADLIPMTHLPCTALRPDHAVLLPRLTTPMPLSRFSSFRPTAPPILSSMILTRQGFPTECS